MKKIFICIAITSFAAACNTAPKADNADTADKKTVEAVSGETYRIDSALSRITWTGTKPGGKHTGIFKIKDGSVIVKDNMIAGGSFNIDMASLTNQDLAADAANKAKLEGHLKSPDFFDIAKYPAAKFELTSVVPFVPDSTDKILLKDATHTVSGNLTLKDSTNNISFPARITLDAATLSATANFNIDRTRWGINYKGPGNPQDWFISKDVNLQLSLSASKK